ncbi:hypothetical protein L917_20053, partial [Phytophthora nicotianae]
RPLSLWTPSRLSCRARLWCCPPVAHPVRSPRPAASIAKEAWRDSTVASFREDAAWSALSSSWASRASNSRRFSRSTSCLRSRPVFTTVDRHSLS